jgi:hypothetical protein
MKKSNRKLLLPIIGGILLIGAGVVFLLNNLGLIEVDWEMVIGPLFALGGLVFLIVFILNADDWWALIPGFVLIAIGVIIFMDQNLETAADLWSGAVFLGLLGLSFLLIYIFHTDNWWAIIPGGVLLTLAGVTLVSDEGLLGGAIFFIGLAITFGLVYILPKPSGRLKWALYPAGILLVIGVLVLLGAENLMEYVWPVALLVAGGYVVYRALKK